MSKPRHLSTRVAATILATVASFGSSVVFAEAALMDRPSSCNTVNCNAITIRSSLKAYEMFATSIFVGSNECLRLDVVEQKNSKATPDTTLTLIHPAGTVYLWNDDRAVGEFAPIITRESLENDVVTPAKWKLLVGRFYASGTTTFTLKYGRYPVGNVNCQGDQTPIGFLADGLSATNQKYRADKAAPWSDAAPLDDAYQQALEEYD